MTRAVARRLRAEEVQLIAKLRQVLCARQLAHLPVTEALVLLRAEYALQQPGGLRDYVVAGLGRFALLKTERFVLIRERVDGEVEALPVPVEMAHWPIADFLATYCDCRTLPTHLELVNAQRDGDAHQFFL